MHTTCYTIIYYTANVVTWKVIIKITFLAFKVEGKQHFP